MTTEMEGHETKTLGLFPINVPHVLKKIFFNLDYESYKTCYEVNSSWRELLMSDSYLRKAKELFHEDIKEDEDRLWKAAKEGNLPEVRRLITHLVDVNCIRTDEDATPLIKAAAYGQKGVVKMIVCMQGPS